MTPLDLAVTQSVTHIYHTLCDVDALFLHGMVALGYVLFCNYISVISLPQLVIFELKKQGKKRISLSLSS